jgi:hypothetical protein
METMDTPSYKSGHTGIATALQRLIQVENDLLEIIRARRHPSEYSVYEAHAFVRQAIEVLSREPDPRPRKEGEKNVL